VECLDGYSIHQQPFDILMMLIFGGVGYLMRLLGFPPAPLLVGLVLGPEMEGYLRRSLIVSHGDPMIFLQRPISASVLVFCALAVGWTTYKVLRRSAYRRALVAP
jgi:TctA family transporter